MVVSSGERQELHPEGHARLSLQRNPTRIRQASNTVTGCPVFQKIGGIEIHPFYITFGFPHLLLLWSAVIAECK